jgi:phage-related protein
MARCSLTHQCSSTKTYGYADSAQDSEERRRCNTDTFTWKPLVSQDITPKNTALNTRVEFANGNEQVQQNSVYAKSIWTLQFGGDSAQLVAMQTFWDTNKGGTLFYWTPPSPYDTQATYRFATDNFDPKAFYGTTTGTNFVIVGFTVELSLRLVR